METATTTTTTTQTKDLLIAKIQTKFINKFGDDSVLHGLNFTPKPISTEDIRDKVRNYNYMTMTKNSVGVIELGPPIIFSYKGDDEDVILNNITILKLNELNVNELTRLLDYIECLSLLAFDRI